MKRNIMLSLILVLALVQLVYAAASVKTYLDASGSTSVSTALGSTSPLKVASPRTTTLRGYAVGATQTSDVTISEFPGVVVAAQRIMETTIASSSAQSGVLLTVWNPAVPGLQFVYKNATGTILVGSFTFSTMP